MTSFVCVYIYIYLFYHFTFNLILLNMGEIEVHHISQNIIETTNNYSNHSFWSHLWSNFQSNRSDSITAINLWTTVSTNNCVYQQPFSCQTHTHTHMCTYFLAVCSLDKYFVSDLILSHALSADSLIKIVHLPPKMNFKTLKNHTWSPSVDTFLFGHSRPSTCMTL